MTAVLMKWEIWTQTHTGRVPCEDWSYVTISLGVTRSWRRGLEQTLPQSLQRAHSPADSLTSDTSRTGQQCGNTCWLFKSLSLCYSGTAALHTHTHTHTHTQRYRHTHIQTHTHISIAHTPLPTSSLTSALHAQL
jgi:hypothetical protein